MSALVALGLLALFAPEHASVEAVPASRFNKPVDDRKLDEVRHVGEQTIGPTNEKWTLSSHTCL